MAVGERPVALFLGGDDGYGYSLNNGRNVYHWTMNWDCRPGRRSVPAMAPTFLAFTFLSAISSAFEASDTDGAPIILVTDGTGTAARVSKVKNGSIAGENNQSSTAPYTDGVLYRTSGASPNVTVAYFCNGDDQEALTQRLASSGAYTRSGHDAKADVLGIVGEKLWRARGYEISILTLDADPGVDSNWGAAIPVGIPAYPVNKIIQLGGSGLVLKGDGVFRYNPNPSSAVFEPITPFVTPHRDNGKNGFTDGRGRVYYDTADGHILVITFGFQDSETPAQFTWIDRDTPWGPISALTADVDYIYAAIRPGNTRTQQLSLYVQSNDVGDAGFVNETSAVTDQSYATSADLSVFTTNDELYVGAIEPFDMIWFDILARRTALGSALAIAVSDGATGWTTITSTCRDSTHAFMRSGGICIKGNTDIVADGTWQTDTVNSITGRYWVRIIFQAATTSLKLREVAIVPHRPPLDPNTHILTGPALSGALPKVLVGSWQGERILWQDVWTLDAAEVEQMVVSRTTSANSVGDRTLYCFSGDGVHYMPVGAEADPSRAPWPRLGDYGDGTVSQDEHVIVFSGNDFGFPHLPKRVGGQVVIDMKHVQTDDEVWFVYWWDEDAPEYHVKGGSAQDGLVIEDLEGEGRVLYSALLYKDGSRDAIAPSLPIVIIPKGQWETLEAADQPSREDISSPMNR